MDPLTLLALLAVGGLTVSAVGGVAEATSGEPRRGPATEAEPVTPGVTRQYDPLFRAASRGAGGTIPIAFFRALAQRESSMNPRDQHGPAWGLMQVVEVARRDYNQRNNTSVARQELLDPAVNVRVAADILHQIVAAYRADFSELRPNWRDPNYVGLVVAGWNAGWSRRGGVLKVARWLADRGKPITLESVERYAERAGAVRFLSEDEGRGRWWRSVVALYLKEAARDRKDGIS